MVAPLIYLWDGNAENLIYLVFPGLTTRPTLPVSLLSLTHSASRAGRLLAVTKISSAYPQICVKLLKIMLLCSIFFRALWRTRLSSVADKPSPCLTPISIKKVLLIFPSTITLAQAPSSVIFTSRSIFWAFQNSLVIPVIPKAFFGLYCQKLF